MDRNENDTSTSLPDAVPASQNNDKPVAPHNDGSNERALPVPDVMDERQRNDVQGESSSTPVGDMNATGLSTLEAEGDQDDATTAATRDVNVAMDIADTVVGEEPMEMDMEADQADFPMRDNGSPSFTTQDVITMNADSLRERQRTAIKACHHQWGR